MWDAAFQTRLEIVNENKHSLWIVAHYLSLYKEKVNKTFVGNEPLVYGDCIILNHGDIIKLPDADLRFEIPNEDDTDYETAL